MCVCVWKVSWSREKVSVSLCKFFYSILVASFILSVAGGSSKTLLIAHVCSNSSNMSETLATLNFSSRARNAELSLGNRDTIKKWKDVVSTFFKCLKNMFTSFVHLLCCWVELLWKFLYHLLGKWFTEGTVWERKRSSWLEEWSYGAKGCS